mmetsp:Transcript_11325/g.20935  ORF Transcript_11325/g.20935 Transcript_11325/m.20935 type:complete len:650 (+) Transcript_11325:489-2438(+)
MNREAETHTGRRLGHEQPISTTSHGPSEKLASEMANLNILPGSKSANTDKTTRSRNEKELKVDEEEIFDKKSGTQYLKGRLLGKGGFAKCYLFRHLANRHVCAGKCVEKSTLKKDRARRKLLSEIKIHRSLSHKNIVGFEHYFEDSKNVYILLEYCNNQTLMELVKRKKRLSEQQARGILLQLLDGVEYLQNKKVIHRDLKLGNIFLTNGTDVRIGDFGLATLLLHDDERKKTMCGTPNYIAPEVLNGKLGHSFEVDIWSIGVILYTMLIGRPPFETKNVKQTYKRIQANLYSFPSQVEISSSSKALIRAILNGDPKMRPSLAEIRAHDFFNTPIPVEFPGLNDPAVKDVPVPTANKENAGAFGNQALEDERTERMAQMQNERTKRPVTPSSPWLVSPKQTVGDEKTSSVRRKAHAGQTTSPGPVANPTTDPEDRGFIFVEKWADYTSKYGLGYMLRSGSVGVYFNDSTKIVMSPNKQDIQYYERGAQELTAHTMMTYPQALHKKVTLLKHFQTYLERNNSSTKVSPKATFYKTAQSPKHTSEPSTDTVVNSEPLPFVKKWVRTRHAVFFRLSNRTVQVSFFDNTQILLSAQAKMLSFYDSENKLQRVSLSKAKSFPDIAKRLKYTKQILHELVSGATPPSPATRKKHE